jgi:hypothetical protein
MKNKIIGVWMAILAIGILSCDDEKNIEDPIFEFVSFKDESPVNINELEYSTKAYPVVIQLWVFKPYAQDITLNLNVTGHNATEGVDFTVEPSDAVTIKAGSMTSDTIWVKTIDNTAGSANPRTFDVEITSASKSDIKIGLGIADPKQKSVTFNISDDECTLTPAIFATTLDNLINTDGTDQGTNAAVGVVVGNTVSVTGDLIWYGPMDLPLVLTLTPESAGATKGSVAFGEQELGTANDGYEYKFIQAGEGTYNVCSGTINIEYNTFYRAVGETDWTPWQLVKNTLTIP